MSQPGKLAILVGGGPAPGINSVIAAATIRAEVDGIEVEMPPMRLAMAQLVIGPLNFACVAGCLHETLAAVLSTPYLGVASVYVIANFAGLVSHVPGGLGVIESVVTFLLPAANIIGAVLAFRFLYFLVPLALGGILFAVAEIVFRWQAERKRAPDTPDGS